MTEPRPPETFVSYRCSRLQADARLEQGAARMAVHPAVRVTAGGQAKDLTAPVLELLGPQDVEQVADDAFTRHFPESGALDVDPQLRPHVDLAEPDLPWRYSAWTAPLSRDPIPAVGGPRPWLTLLVGPTSKVVVAEDRRSVTVARDVLAPIDLDTLWSWAHVQQTATGHQVGRLLAASADGAGSLEPGTQHTAVVVLSPLAGAPGGAASWPVARDSTSTADAAGPTLPCYHTWTFTTGTMPPFEEVAHRLRGRTVPSGDYGPAVHHPGTETPDPSPSDKWDSPAQGALMVESSRPAGRADALPELRPEVTDAVDLMLQRFGVLPNRPIGLPGYHLLVGAEPYPGASTWASPENGDDWREALDRHPLARIAAGLGVQCAIEWQDRLVAAARDRMGEITTARQRTSHLSLGEQHGRVLRDRVEPGRDDPDRAWAGLALLGPALPRTPEVPAAGVLPAPEFFSAAAKRALRPGTARRGRSAQPGLSGDDLQADLTTLLPDRPPTTIAPLDGERPAALGTAKGPGLVWVPEDQDEYQQAEKVVQARHDGYSTEDVAKVAVRLWQSTDPRPDDGTAPGRVRRQVWDTLQVEGLEPDAWGRTAPLELPVDLIAEPWRFLAERAIEWILPGIGSLPPDSAVQLRTNPAFVDAFLAGLNGQLLAELRWRNVPVATGCTPVRSFWPPRREAGPSSPPTPEVPGYRGSVGPLGNREPHPTTPTGPDPAAGTAPTGLWVALIRSALFVRWPHTQVYLLRPATGQAPAQVQGPALAARLDADTVMFAFSRDPGEQDQLVFEEPPVGLRFTYPMNELWPAPLAPPPNAAGFAVSHLDQPARVALPVTRLRPGGAG